MKITAKEMFEKLGYKKRAFGDCIFYEKGSIMPHIIQFNNVPINEILKNCEVI